MASFQALLCLFVLTVPLLDCRCSFDLIDDPSDCDNKTNDDEATVSSRTNNSTLVSDIQDICALPMERGDCDSYRLVFYFNSTENECKSFFYGGCNGNANNFERIEECENTTQTVPTSTSVYTGYYFDTYVTTENNPCTVVQREVEENALEKFADALDMARRDQEQKHRQLLHTSALLLPLQARYNAKNVLLNVKQRIHSRAVASITKAVASYSDAVTEHLTARTLAREYSHTGAHSSYHVIANAKSAVLDAKMRLLTVYLEKEKRASTAMSSALTNLHEARKELNKAKSDQDNARIEFENAVRYTQKLLQTDPTKKANFDSASQVNDIPGGCREMDGSGEEI
ncbi:kunitz/Bovine pancreatic trypsin inhibitor domain-containing protein [Ditylenchus destructor]|uniref:Kunitz/Bovine pancreatic trypsin inhibitor domain-containing protein n=1 Tax=Ditylenchus destructor TaxID=166010 RepID=A0AAD4MQ79_9BILA|nr:kunitz/Bovine pancreatic trypsin inhibitor domain-containing protein [Ditylenchus destructor]